MMATMLNRVSSVTTLEDEIAEEESLALAEQVESDWMLARATELAAHASVRLAAVAVARAKLVGERLPILHDHDEPQCFESLPDWP